MFGWRVTRDDEQTLTITGWDMLTSLLWGALVSIAGVFFLVQTRSLAVLGLALLASAITFTGFRFDLRMGAEGVSFRERFLWFPFLRRTLPLDAECEVLGLGDYGEAGEFGAQCVLSVSLEDRDLPFSLERFETEYGFGPTRGAEPLAEKVREGLRRFRPQADEERQRILRQGVRRPWVEWMRSATTSLPVLGFRHRSNSIFSDRWSIWRPLFLDWVFCGTIAAFLVLVPHSWGGRGLGAAALLIHLLLARQTISLENRRLSFWSSRWGIRFRKQELGDDFRCSLERDWEWPEGKEVVLTANTQNGFEVGTLGAPWLARELVESVEARRAFQRRDSREAKAK